MDKQQVFKLLQDEILKILPLANPELITPQNSLSDLGANSIDRSEIVINCMTILNIKLDPLTLASLKNIGDLWEALYKATNEE
jgi:polyketide biosynthesis acyl carrier protein